MWRGVPVSLQPLRERKRESVCFSTRWRNHHTHTHTHTLAAQLCFARRFQTALGSIQVSSSGAALSRIHLLKAGPWESIIQLRDDRSCPITGEREACGQNLRCEAETLSGSITTLRCHLDERQCFLSLLWDLQQAYRLFGEMLYSSWKDSV